MPKNNVKRVHDALLTFHVSSTLKEQFVRKCEEKDTIPSMCLRGLVRRYVKGEIK